MLRTAQKKPSLLRGKVADPDFEWETMWIDYLDQAGEPGAAQTARWASFERTLWTERARAFVNRLPDFEDVEAESRALPPTTTSQRACAS